MRACEHAQFFLVAYLLVLGIVVLNALIALLGDSYQRVQDNQVCRAPTPRDLERRSGQLAAARHHSRLFCSGRKLILHTCPAVHASSPRAPNARIAFLSLVFAPPVDSSRRACVCAQS